MTRSAEEGALIYAMDGDIEGLEHCLDGFTVRELDDLLSAVSIVEAWAYRVRRAKQLERAGR